MLRDGIKTLATIAVSIAGCLAIAAGTAHAQTTDFTYEGKLTDGGAPATGPYDLTFRLFSTPAGGSPIGGDLVRHDVQVTSGLFTVTLDFGLSPFTATTGGFLEIAVRAGAGTGAYTTLTPRQPITSSSFAVETVRATSGAAAVTDDGPRRVSDVLTPAVRGGNAIPNITAEPSNADLNTGRRGMLASRGRVPDIFASSALPTGRRTPEAPALDFGLATLNAARIGQGSPDEYRIHVITPSNRGLRVQTDSPGGAVASFGGYGDFQIDAPGVVGGRFAVKGDGRVGLGTDAPLARLDLRGGADGNGANDPQALAFQWHGGGYRHWIRTRHNAAIGSSNAIDFFVNNAPFADGSAGPGSGSTHVMTLDSGRVGIGTTNPAEKLTVEGVVQSTAGGFKFPDGTVQTSAASTTAASAVYTTYRIDDSVAVPHSGPVASIIHLNLPTGTYLVTATILFYNNAAYFAQDNTRDIYCLFSGESRSYSFYFPGSRSFSVTMHSVMTISSGGVDVQCHGSGLNQDLVFAYHRRLTAMKIEGNVIVQ